MSFHRNNAQLLFGLIAYGCLVATAYSQVLLSDTFERTTGTFGMDGPPPVPSTTDWGSFNNGLGGSVASVPYIVTQADTNNIQSVGLDQSGDYDGSNNIDNADFFRWQRELGTMPANPGEGADGNFSGTVGPADLDVWRRNFGGPFGKGELRFGRTILDVNLAALPAVQSSGGFVVQADISPSDTGNPGGVGRDWAALMLADTKDTEIIGGPQAIANLNNDNIRFGAAPRNSGSLLRRINNEPAGAGGAGDQLFGVGNPFNAGINEPIIDNSVFNNYSINYLGSNSPSPPDNFVNNKSYAVKVDVDAPNGFGVGATAFATLTVDGNAIYTNEMFTWGEDAEDANSVYLGFVGFGPTNDTVGSVAGNEFDNLRLSSNGTVLLSDNFNGRTTGNATEPGGSSSWGAVNNGLGGSIAASYLTTSAGNALQQTVEGGVGVLRTGRTILDLNLANNSTIQSNGEFTVEFEIDPTDDGAGGVAGRSWAGFALGHTNDTTQWGSEQFLPFNADARLGFAPRNSGTMLSVARGGFGALLDGNPSNPFNEIIFDAEVFDDYSSNYNPASGQPFLNFKEYTLRIEVDSDFSAGAASTATVFIGEVGGTLTNVGTFDFVWGENAGEAYLALGGNQALHKIDNLVIEALPSGLLANVPEPTTWTLTAMATFLLCGRRRNRRVD